MKPIILKDKTKELLKQLDAQIKATNEKGQEALNQFNTAIKGLQTQKQNILGVIVLELGIADDAHLKLDENYNLVEVDEKTFNNLAANPNNPVMDVSKTPIPLEGKKFKSVKRK